MASAVTLSEPRICPAVIRKLYVADSQNNKRKNTMTIMFFVVPLLMIETVAILSVRLKPNDTPLVPQQ